ncbi:MAG: hypothetical protein AAB541_00530 [Patescibacteria group bacterium]
MATEDREKIVDLRKNPGVETTSTAPLTPEESSAVRGLGRMTTIGREVNGLPITRRGEIIEGIMKRNRNQEAHEQEVKEK